MKKSLIVILGIIVIVILCILVYFTMSRNTTPTATQQPAQSIDQNAKWQVYTNDKYGFEISYPSDLKIEATSPDGKFVIKSPGIGFGSLDIQFTSEEYLKTLDQEQAAFDKWQKDIQETSPSVPKAEMNDILFAGSPAKEFIYYSPVGFTQQRIILSKNNYTIIIDSYKGTILETILSTFKFTK